MMEHILELIFGILFLSLQIYHKYQLRNEIKSKTDEQTEKIELKTNEQTKEIAKIVESLRPAKNYETFEIEEIVTKVIGSLRPEYKKEYTDLDDYHNQELEEEKTPTRQK